MLDCARLEHEEQLSAFEVSVDIYGGEYQTHVLGFTNHIC